MDWKGKTVLVLGLGDTGLSCLRWLASQGAQLRAADSRAAPAGLGAAREACPGIAITPGPFAEALLAGVDTVAASPGISLREPILVAAARRGVEIVGDVEIFGRELARGRELAPAGQPRVIGITGTNGKSTVTALAGAMGRAAGLRTVVAGNIGLPVLDALAAAGQHRPPELYVVELSSYQLETTSSLHLDAAAMLNLSQDHLDRHGTMSDYAAAKARIFRHCQARVVNRDDAWSLAMAGGSRTLSFGLGEPAPGEWGISRGYLMEGTHVIEPLGEMAMTGLHNAANALAAHALMRAIDTPRDPLAKAIREFRGLPHRVELVAEARGVRYYNDSKGTNVGACVAALEGFTRPLVLIAGGDGKGQDFSPLAPAVRAHARAVVLIGRDAPAIESAISATGIPVEHAPSMRAAVSAAARLARSGDAVLLSPACASFDMFRNFGHRGEAFAEAAREIAAGPGH